MPARGRLPCSTSSPWGRNRCVFTCIQRTLTPGQLVQAAGSRSRSFRTTTCMMLCDSSSTHHGTATTMPTSGRAPAHLAICKPRLTRSSQMQAADQSSHAPRSADLHQARALNAAAEVEDMSNECFCNKRRVIANNGLLRRRQRVGESSRSGLHAQEVAVLIADMLLSRTML